MAIRMEKDPSQTPRKKDSNNSSGGLMRWIPFILLFLFKRPKLIIPALIIAGVWYFFLGGQQQLNGGLSTPELSDFELGALLSEEKFDQAQVFEPLAYGSGNFNRLPSSASLARYAPPALHQGSQGSCVGWASAYAARTILHSRASGQSPNNATFSPSYLYNQIALSGCQGAYMLDAMKAMRQNGALPFGSFRYNERTCSNHPDQEQLRAGQQFRIKGYNRLTQGVNNYKPDITAIKQNLAQGAPVVIGMQVGGTFMSRMLGQDAWAPTQRDYSLRGFSGHAMCVIGYDDNRNGGSFHIMNSWGQEWGNRGRAWVQYRDFEYFVKEAYGLFPMGSSTDQKFDKNKMQVEFGLLDINTQKTLPLKQKSSTIFQTQQPIRKGDKFKVLFANSIDCYVYVFGQEANGSSSVLFPYTPKHSPYCGITGTRLFPRDYSMTADNVGNKDLIALVVSKRELNFDQLNNKINSSRSGDYAGKLRDALGSTRISEVAFKAGKTVSFDAQLNGKSAVGMVIEIDKR